MKLARLLYLAIMSVIAICMAAKSLWSALDASTFARDLQRRCPHSSRRFYSGTRNRAIGYQNLMLPSRLIEALMLGVGYIHKPYRRSFSRARQSETQNYRIGQCPLTASGTHSGLFFPGPKRTMKQAPLTHVATRVFRTNIKPHAGFFNEGFGPPLGLQAVTCFTSGPCLCRYQRHLPTSQFPCA